MPNLKRIFIMIIGLFLLSGCDVTYNLKISKDLKVEEEISALEDNEYNDLSHDFLLDRISVSFSSRYEEIYNYSAISNENQIGNRLFKKYNSITDYKENSSVFKDLVKNYEITETGNIVNLNITISDNIYDRSNLAYTIIPNNMNINIDLPFQVTNSNADFRKGNIYTWQITQEKRSSRIILSFDKNRLSNHIYVLNIGISYVILLVIGIILVVSVLSLFIYKRITGINKI